MLTKWTSGFEHLDHAGTDPVALLAMLLRIASGQTTDAIAACELAARVSENLAALLDIAETGRVPARSLRASIRSELDRSNREIAALRDASRQIGARLDVLKARASEA